MNECTKCQNENPIDITVWLVIAWFFTSPISILCAYMLGRVNKAASKEKAKKVYTRAKAACILNAVITTPIYVYLIYILIKIIARQEWVSIIFRR